MNPAAKEILDRIPGLLAIMTPAGGVDTFNRRLAEYCGAESPDDLARVIERFTQAVATGDRCEHNTRIRRSDGVDHWFSARGTPLREADGTISCW